MWPYPWTHVGTPSHLGHMDRVAATMPSQAHAGAAQEAPDIGQWEGQDVPLVRPSSCNVKGGIPSSRRYLPTYLGFARFGWVVPLCLFGGPVFGAFWVGGLAASGGVGGLFGGCGLFSRPPFLPPLFFFGGGAACSSLCFPWAGARTGLHSVWSSGLLLAVAFCLAVFRPHGSGGLCTRWARRPFLPG